MATTLVDGVVAMFAGKAPSGCRPQLLAFRVSITRSLRGMGLSEQDAHRQAEIIEHRASEELHWIWQGISFEPEHAAEGR